jgi:hypothetical protein
MTRARLSSICPGVMLMLLCGLALSDAPSIDEAMRQFVAQAPNERLCGPQV